MATLEKLMNSIMCGTQDKNIKFKDLQKLLDVLGFECRIKGGRVMHKYERIIYWSKEDESFIVEVPELPGCMADGKTIQEAVQNAEIVIDEWLEVARERGQEIPEPKGKLVYA